MDKGFFEDLMKRLERNRNNYDTEKLVQLAKSSDPKDKETFTSTVVDILESDDIIAYEFLVANGGIDLNSKEYDGKTPLSIAASAGSIKIVKLLLGQMKAADVCKYNQEHLLYLRLPKILPDLWLVEDVIAIVNLFVKKKIEMTLEHKLAVLEFLVHNTDECDCGNIELNAKELTKNLSNAMVYGSEVHILNIKSKIEDGIAAQKLKWNGFDILEYLGKPLSPVTLLGLYAEGKVRVLANDWEDSFPMNYDHHAEWKMLKAHKLKKNDKLSLLDVLAMNPCKTYQHVSKLDFHKLSKKYMCAGNYMKGLKAKSLIRHEVEKFLPDFMRALFPPLPDCCFNKIWSYMRELSNEDILSMSQVAVNKWKIENVWKLCDV